MDADRPAWQTDELSEEWVPEAAEGSATSGGPARAVSGSQEYGGSMLIRGGTVASLIAGEVDGTGDAGSLVVRSMLMDAGGPGSMVVKEDEAKQGEDPPAWLKAAVDGLGNMFGPNRLQRMFEQPMAPAPQTPTKETLPSTSFMTPSEALHRRSLTRSLSASQGAQAPSAPIEPFDFAVPRPHTAWKSQPHFVPSAPEFEEAQDPGPDTEHSGDDERVTPERHSKAFEPTPRPRQGRYLRSSQTAGIPQPSLDEEDTSHSTAEEHTASTAPSIQFAHETPAPRFQQTDAPEAEAAEQTPYFSPSGSSRPFGGQSGSQSHSKVFSFPYDTFTRNHLSRLVEEIDDLSAHSSSIPGPTAGPSNASVAANLAPELSVGPGHSTPPPVGATSHESSADHWHAGRTPFRASLLRQKQEEKEWAESFLEPSEYAKLSTSGGGNEDEGDDGDIEGVSSSERPLGMGRIRSSKRVRLSPPRSRIFGGSGASNRSGRSAALGRRQQDSLVVAANRASPFRRPPTAYTETPRTVPSSVRSRRLRSAAATPGPTPSARRGSARSDAAMPETKAEGPKRDLLAEAQALMARIKAKGSRDPVTAPVAPLNDGVEESSSAAESVTRLERPRAPTPRSSWGRRTGHDLGESQDRQSSSDGTQKCGTLPPLTPLLDQELETTEDDEHTESAEWERAAQSFRIKTPGKAESPRKLLRKLTAADEVDAEETQVGLVETEEPPVWEIRLDEDGPAASVLERTDYGFPAHEHVEGQGQDWDSHTRVSAATASIRHNFRNQDHVGLESLASARSPAAHAPDSRRHFATQPLLPTRPSLPLALSVPAPSSRAPSTNTAISNATSAAMAHARHSLATTGSLGGSRLGLMTIGPEDVEDLLSQRRLGKMIFDASSGRWLRAGRSSINHTAPMSLENIPPAPIQEESVWQDNEDEGSSGEEEDPFRDFESLTSRRARSGADGDLDDDGSASSGDEHEFIPHDDAEEYAVRIPEAEGDQSRYPDVEVPHSPPPKPVQESPARPRSALKGKSHNSHTPAYFLDQQSKANRSVSFSDDRAQGRVLGAVPSQDARGTRLLDTSDDESEARPNASAEPSARTQRIAAALDELQDHGAVSLVEPSPSLSLLGGGGRRFRPKASALRRSTSSDNSAPPDGVDEGARANNANATFLTECSFGISHDHLVKLITDVEPFEPSWEQLKIIDLSEKGVESLVRLKEFLPRLDEANLQGNKIAFLTGVPASVRSLLLASNSLTSVSSFGHLSNLERLDISHNRIESVQQLASLRHLRELKADCCQIADLGGLTDLDGLTKLSLKGNRLRALDCSTARWSRLEVLNVARNDIGEVAGIARLGALQLLNLDHNDLCTFEVTEPMPRLRGLRLCDNHLEHVDVKLCANLRTLFIDSCDSVHIEGASRLRKLENLSVRDQRGRGMALPTKHIRDVKRLYLSGNPIPATLLSQRFFNLVYLELAMCQISVLPADFAAAVPNVRTVNLNYNFLSDLSPLAGLARLQKLTVLGSRLKSCGRPLVEVLQTLPELELLDLRMNPSTLGFYPPLLVEDATDDGVPHATYRIVSSRAPWSDVDTKFRKSLPNEYYLRRATYRAVLLHTCPRLRLLDGLLVSKADRVRMGKLLRGLERKIDQGHDLVDVEYSQLTDAASVL